MTMKTDPEKEEQQKAVGISIAEELTKVLRRFDELDGIGESTVSEIMVELPDAKDLADKLAGISFAYGPRVDHMFASWMIRLRGEDDEVDTDKALSLLLLNEVVFTNTNWWCETWPLSARKTLYLGVNCSDVFAWGCSDAEELPRSKIDEVFTYWEKDPVHGHEIWCIIQRKQLPQNAVHKAIVDRGIWNLDELTKEHNLRANYYSGLSLVYAERKYALYVDWCKARGSEPLPFDNHWWKGWQEYVANNPDWETEEWKAVGEKARREWIDNNGYGEAVATKNTGDSQNAVVE